MGCAEPLLCLYTPHRPPLEQCKNLNGYRPAYPGETAQIIAETGNHWRKIFTIFAKIYTELICPDKRWQEVRDQRLFTENSHSALLFQDSILPIEQGIHIIGGKDFAAGFTLPTQQGQCIDDAGKVLAYGNCYLTPYLDYRQFPNALIDQLVAHLQNTPGKNW